MKTLTNKLVMSVLALVLTGVALSVGVFAWFTVNNQANVGAFSGTVQTGEGFYVSLDGSSWTNTLTAAQMQAAANASVDTQVEFNAMTSSNGMSFFDVVGDPVTGGFIEFDLYFAASASLDAVDLTYINIAGSQTSWIPGIYVPGTRQELNDTNTPIIDFVSNAARVSFTDILLETQAAVVVEQRAGAGESTIAADPAENGNSVGILTNTTNEAFLFYNAIMADPLTFPDPLNIATTTTPDFEGAIELSVATLIPYVEGDAGDYPVTYNVTTIENAIGENYRIGAITVRVWIEGWDSEAFNAILSGILTLDMRFTGVTV